MTRRALFAALASLPFVGRLAKAQANKREGARRIIHASNDDEACQIMTAERPTWWARLTDLDGRTTRFLYTRQDGTEMQIHLPGARL